MPDLDLTVTTAWPRRQVACQSRGLLRATGSVDDFMQWLVAIAARTVGGDVWVAITLIRDGQPVTVAGSEPDTTLFDRMAYSHDEGPCQSAIRADRVVLVQDVVRDERFGEYRARAQVLGVRSTLSIPLHSNAVAVGALTLCARHLRAFGHKQRAEAQRFANDASFALDLAARRADDVEITARPGVVSSRTVIDQATGVVMGRSGCDADTAIAVLHASSRESDVRLGVVAAEMIAEVSSRTWYAVEQVDVLDRPDADPASGSAIPLRWPHATGAVGASALEAAALESSCWCSAHGGI